MRLLLTLFVCLALSPQVRDTVSYGYDAAGNRISREVKTSTRSANGKKTGKLQSVAAKTGMLSETESSQGDSLITYKADYFDFGAVVHPAQRSSLVISEEEKSAFEQRRRLNQGADTEGINLQRVQRKTRDLSGYSVGEIPMQEGVSPTGARTCSIPIMTVPGIKFAPSIALGYSSQAAEGWAGYGWDITGLHSITLISENTYYHGIAKGADVYDTDAAFALDGIPLVRNTQSETSAAFPLITARGNIIVSPEYNSRGYAISFTAKYPDGTTAAFGIGDDVPYNKPSYPVTQITDLDGGRIQFVYASDRINGNDRLTAVRYGFVAGVPEGEITLEYSYDSAMPVKYYAGKTVSRASRVSSISSRSGDEVLCTYGLEYQKRDATWLLNKVSCTSDGKSLPPIEFEYGHDADAVSSRDFLYKRDSLLLSSSFNSSTVDMVYRRGKFVKGSYNDGLLIYPLFPNYDVTGHTKGKAPYTFGSRYSEDQVILFAPSLSGFSDVDNSITTGSGFQTIEAVDTDGDGLDEIVKVNFAGVSGDYSLLRITVYECSSSGTPQQKESFTVPVKGKITSGKYTSPCRRAYFWGDFRGNGKTQLLTIAYDKNYNSAKNYSQDCYAALIDIASHSKLSETVLFNFPIEESGGLLCVDLDNDTRTELCHAITTGIDIYNCSGSSFSKTRTLSIPSLSFFTDTTRQVFITDINGDGYIDIVQAPAVGSGIFWRDYYYNGHAFESTSFPLTYRQEGDEFFWIDVNRDGFADLVRINGTRLGSYLNRNGVSFGSYTESPSKISSAKGIVPSNVVDYLGMSCFIKIDGFFAHEYNYTPLSPNLRLLTKSTDSKGRMVSGSYLYLPSASRYWTDAADRVDNAKGFVLRTLPMYVLDREVFFPVDGKSSGSRSFSYYDGVVHNFGLGFCGFSKVRTYDDTGPVTQVNDITYDPQRLGIVTLTESFLGSARDSAVRSTSYTYYDRSTTYGKLNPRLARSVEHDGRTGITTEKSYIYDDYDFPTTINTSRRVGSGAALTKRLTRSYIDSVSVSVYVLGTVTEETLVSDGDSNDALSWKERTFYTYDGRFRRTKSIHYVGDFAKRELVRDSIVPLRPAPALNDSVIGTVPYRPRLDATNLVSETRWTYDSLGNILSEKTAMYGATEFTGNAYAYDGYRLLSSTDALGRTTTFSGYDKFGNATVQTDYRGHVTSLSYDEWGNATLVSRPDGTVETTAMSWGGKGLYTVAATVTGKPETVVHYDALDREVRSEEKRFDGSWLLTDRTYDVKGRLRSVSLPNKGESPSYLNTYTYDEFDRPVSLVEASGKTSMMSYNGTSTTVTREAVASTRTTDAEGNLIRVNDAGGTLTYAVRDDGQVSSVSLQGGGSCTFKYDHYGRKTLMYDSSAGVQTYSYSCNSDGSTQLTHANSSGTVKTGKDKYGRVTRIERVGDYTTTYSYDGRSGLLLSEQSTNGSSKEYAYDDFDRAASVIERVPDGSWLRTDYFYGIASVLDSVRFTTASGEITTESYSYANGHKTRVALSDGTLLWELKAENDLGKPTVITTGTITREYGFTPYGLPMYRRMKGGELQDFRYDFDPLTGNLLSRSDEKAGTSETFSYDSLGRLTSVGSRQISYDAIGNILSIDDVGTMDYVGYKVRELSEEALTSLVPDRGQSIAYTCFSRPASIDEGLRHVSFTYGSDDQRVKMEALNDTVSVLSRYYIAGRYECDREATGSTERLYLGGDAYSAPMVYIRHDAGEWAAYNIGRDYLGSITQIATSDGDLVEEYSYDPWGRLRDAQTLEPYPAGQEPELFLGRGFTAHEHMQWFGLINMNARLYDPLTGRFLSPDPYIQAPDFSQNFNRYSYALNNPLKYTDESGEIVGTILTAILRLPLAITEGVIVPFFVGFSDTAEAGRKFVSAWGDYGNRVSNAFKIDMGVFATDSNLSFVQNALSIASRLTWEFSQTTLGNTLSHFRNNFWQVNVEHYHGATLVNRFDPDKNGWGITLGSYINGLNLQANPAHDYTFAHEFGHTKQSKILGPSYVGVVGVPSIIGSVLDYDLNLSDHDREWYEVWANQLSYDYFDKHGRSDVTDDWSRDNHPLVQNPDWYFYATLGYYALGIAAIVLVL